MATELITRRQRDVLAFVADSIARNRFPPTIRECMRHFRINSTNGMHDHLRALERKGMLQLGSKRARAMVLTDAGWAESGVAKPESAVPTGEYVTIKVYDMRPRCF